MWFLLFYTQLWYTENVINLDYLLFENEYLEVYSNE